MLARSTSVSRCSRVSSSRPAARLQIICKAVDSDVAVARRAVLFSSVLPLMALSVSPALALILDEEDEELVEKAKANRAKKLASDKAITREFMQAEGLKDAQLDQDLIPVQRAVFNLAKSGSQLEAGDVKGASSTLSEPWVSDFQVASAKIGSGSEAVVAKLGDLQAAAKGGDGKASKKAYVALVGALQSWTSAAGLSSKLKGI